MANAAPEEPSMEEILSSIRKIVSRGENEAEAVSGEPRGEPSPQRRAEDREVADTQLLDQASQQTSAPERTEPTNPVQQPRSDASTTAARQGESLADLARRVREQMPRTGFQTPMSRKPFSPGPEIVSGQSESQEKREEVRKEAIEPEMEAKPVERAPPASQQRKEDTQSAMSPSSPSPTTKSEPKQVVGEEEAFRDALVAPATQIAVGRSIERLKQSAMDGTQAQVEAILRPMLREWLNENLPQLVERVVRDEIERIARAQPE